MANFNEVHFYDGTLNTNLSLEDAHAKVSMLRDDVERRADTVRNLAGSSYTGGSSGSGLGGGISGGGGLSLVEKRRAARRKKSKRSGSTVTAAQAGALFNGVLDGDGTSSNSSGYGSQMGMIMEEESESNIGESLMNLMEDVDDADDMSESTSNLVMTEASDDIQGRCSTTIVWEQAAYGILEVKLF